MLACSLLSRAAGIAAAETLLKINSSCMTNIIILPRLISSPASGFDLSDSMLHFDHYFMMN